MRLHPLRLTIALGATLAAAPAPFSWPGTYELVGRGFPEGERRAVIVFARRDTSYTVASVSSLPGAASSLRVVGDSAQIVWDLGERQTM